MDYLTGVLKRTSMPLLQDPAPSDAQLENILQAALRAPDHGNLKPFRFVIVAGKARETLGQLFLQRQLEKDPETNDFTKGKFRNMPLRAPMLICLITTPQVHPKIPMSEQIQATACAGQNILHAAHAQGLGAVWRTGWLAHDSLVIKQLGIKEEEQLLGFIYIGTPKCEPREAPVINTKNYVQNWQG